MGFETLGGLGASAREFLGDLSRRLVHVTGDSRAGEYLCQRLSLELLRGNVGSIMGSVEQRVVDNVLSLGVGHGEVVPWVTRRERAVILE